MRAPHTGGVAISAKEEMGWEESTSVKEGNGPAGAPALPLEANVEFVR